MAKLKNSRTSPTKTRPSRKSNTRRVVKRTKKNTTRKAITVHRYRGWHRLDELLVVGPVALLLVHTPVHNYEWQLFMESGRGNTLMEGISQDIIRRLDTEDP